MALTYGKLDRYSKAIASQLQILELTGERASVRLLLRNHIF
ncbi:hypothetical protein [Nostoc sp. LPT]|nr:hypothetical protein [Nostoc sp. LPT]